MFLILGSMTVFVSMFLIWKHDLNFLNENIKHFKHFRVTKKHGQTLNMTPTHLQTLHTPYPMQATLVQTSNIYCQQNHAPCVEGYELENKFKTYVKSVQPLNKSRFVITLPYQDFHGWFTHWQGDIFSAHAMRACSHKCELIYDQHSNADAVLFIMKKQSVFQAPHQVILNVEPYGFLPDVSYASYFSSSTYQVSYALSETHVKPDNFFPLNTSWYSLFNSFAQPQKKEIEGVAWLSKSCDRHNNYLQRLMKFISIDMYGPCFNNKNEVQEFPGLENAHRGLRKLEIGSHYRFYISLENTIIPHYVSEKFYQGFLLDSVMVYLGAPNANDYQPAENSFINALHFDSPESLGTYLIYLSNNPVKYEEHLVWKNEFFKDKGLTPLPGFLQAIENSFERTDVKSVLCRICNSLGA